MAGYVTRHWGQTDRRSVYVHLEPATYAAFACIYAPCGQAVADLEASLPAPQRETARHVLHELARAISHQEQRLQSNGGHDRGSS